MKTVIIKLKIKDDEKVLGVDLVCDGYGDRGEAGYKFTATGTCKDCEYGENEKPNGIWCHVEAHSSLFHSKDHFCGYWEAKP